MLQMTSELEFPPKSLHMLQIPLLSQMYNVWFFTYLRTKVLIAV